MSQNVTDETKKMPVSGNISHWIFGALVSAISIMYLDAKADKDFLKEQLKAANFRADKAESERIKADQRTVDCHNLRAERAESSTEAAERVYLEKKAKP
jgi:hypothetical protein